MLTPDILFDSYRDITPAFLQSQGVTLLLTDLDYTLAPKAVRRPDDALRQWIDGLKDAGITVMIVSNNRSGVRDRVLRRSGHRLSGPCRKAQSKGPAGRYGANRNRSGPHRHAGR